MIKATIKSAVLYVRKVKISPQILLAHSMALEKATAKCPIKRVVVKTYSISQNSPDFNDISSNDISDYGHGYTLFAFDITPDLCDGDHFNLLKSGLLLLEFQFASNLVQPIHLIVYMEFDNLIEINASRKIIKDYQI